MRYKKAITSFIIATSQSGHLETGKPFPLKRSATPERRRRRFVLHENAQNATIAHKSELPGAFLGIMGNLEVPKTASIEGIFSRSNRSAEKGY